ncbi:MAG: methylmalonyl Co-A mutase-associated GTPase MeaB [Proteobacteria bacterium]|nr:methylmalonyl Co-A mutase-associated GTPase MeaB [Pseudomonadota bacterium]
MKKTDNLIENIKSGDIRSIARGISIVENGGYEREMILQGVYTEGHSYIVGITGPPGAGKSSLIDLLINKFKNYFKKVAVLAIDPSSPFTGGAILGDRIRMQRHTGDPDVYIRSMASRGHLGGISGATKDAIKVVSAAGYDLVIVETVGVGQSEIDVVKLADTTVLVLVPGLGDEIQAMKSGIMEIGDLFVINKSDRPESEKLATIVKWMVDEHYKEKKYKPPIILTSVYKNEGIEETARGIISHKDYIYENNIHAQKIKMRIEDDIRGLLEGKLNSFIEHHIKYPERIEQWVEKIYNGRSTPFDIVKDIHENLIIDVKEKI